MNGKPKGSSGTSRIPGSAFSKRTWHWSYLSTGLAEIVGLAGSLVKVRDTVLLSVAVIYVAGYIVWALNAWVNNLGLLPAVDLQYFVAGLIPVGTLAIVWVVLRGCLEVVRQLWEITRQTITAVRESCQRRFSKTVKRNIRRSIYVTVVFPIIVGGVVLIALTDENVLGVGLMLGGGFLWSLVIKLLGDEKPTKIKETRSKIDRIFAWYFIGLAALFLGVWLIFSMVLLVVVVYPAVPQELGGIRPRCAHLEVETSNMSRESIRMFFPDLDIESIGGTLRTAEVKIIYSRGDMLMVRPPGVNSNQVHELRGGVVQAIVGCE